jgi:hypothetical protein
MTAQQLDLLDWIADPEPRVRPPRGSHQARARWLADQILSGVLTRSDIADALAINPPDVEALLAGRTTLASSAWRKLAAVTTE